MGISDIPYWNYGISDIPIWNIRYSNMEYQIFPYGPSDILIWTIRYSHLEHQILPFRTGILIHNTHSHLLPVVTLNVPSRTYRSRLYVPSFETISKQHSTWKKIRFMGNTMWNNLFLEEPVFATASIALVLASVPLKNVPMDILILMVRHEKWPCPYKNEIPGLHMYMVHKHTLLIIHVHCTHTCIAFKKE